MDKEFNLISAIRTILKWRNPILIITVVAGIAAALFSVFVMDEYFYAWSTFYPTNQAMSERATIFGNENQYVDYFGGKPDINRILTIANSTPVINFVIDSFHLVEHYKIDTTKKFWRTKVRKKFDKNYEAKKTEHDAVEVSLYDTDPKMAADIVNAIVDKVDVMNRQLQNDTKKKNRVLIQSEIGKLQDSINFFINTLAELGQTYKIKVSSGTDGTVIVDGNDYKAVQQYKAIMSKENNATRELNNLNNIVGQLEVASKNSESSLYVLERGFPADRREKPTRSLVVLITVLITAFVSVLGVLLIEQIQEIKKQL